MLWKKILLGFCGGHRGDVNFWVWLQKRVITAELYNVAACRKINSSQLRHVAGHAHISPMVAVTHVTVNQQLSLNLVALSFQSTVRVNRALEFMILSLEHTQTLSTKNNSRSHSHYNVSWMGNSCASIRAAIVCVLTALEGVIYL